MSEAVEGTCALCGQVMVRDGDDAWHPWNVERACPPEPGPMNESRENFDAWQAFYAAGLRTGRPGVEHFRSQLERP